MKGSILSIILGALMLSACGGSNSTSSAMTTWSFSGDNGPEFWHLVVDKNGDPYTTCKEGQRQSPIDIPASSLTATDLNNIDFQYQATQLVSTNLGFRIFGYDLEKDDTTQQPIVENAIEFDNTRYLLKQIHFHAPSEHKIDGNRYEGTLHFIHQSEAGISTFLVVFLQVGAENPHLATLIDRLPDSVEQTQQVSFDPTTLLPPESQRASYRYSGSFTIPPCTENVNWVIMQTPIELSQAQMDTFKLFSDNNIRPTQPLNKRGIKLDSTPTI